MLKFLSKTILFFTIIFVIGIIITETTNYKNYSNSYLREKIDFLKNTNSKFNTYFIGSSKINNQINCNIIDSIHPKLKSYNLGVNASFFLENIQTIEYILQDKELNPEIIILELQEKINLSRQNLLTERSYNVFDFSNLKFGIKYHLQNKSYPQISYTILSYLLNNLHYNKTPKKVEYDSLIPTKIKYNKGFFELEYDKFNKRHEELLKDTTIITRRKSIFLNDTLNHALNPIYIDKLNNLNAKCKEQNIKLILLIPAPAEPDAKILLQFAEKIKIPVIQFITVKDNPEFYKMEYRFDYGHLNTKGANLLSKKIGIKLQKIIL